MSPVLVYLEKLTTAHLFYNGAYCGARTTIEMPEEAFNRLKGELVEVKPDIDVNNVLFSGRTFCFKPLTPIEKT